jgi:uncharacterized protein (TIGR03435 family)
MKLALRPAIVLSAICAITSLTAADEPKFEVASAKRTDQCSFTSSTDPGAVVLKGYPLKPILVEAFKLRKEQISGPAWLDEDCFEIVAKMPEGATKDQVPAMLQSLLIERFKLATHKETSLRPMYALIVDKNGPKFKESDPGFHRSAVPSGAVRFGFGANKAIKGSMTMASLVRLLSNNLDPPVQDFTGLKGTYDIDLQWTPEPATAADPPAAPTADIFTAIRDSLGLKLDPRKAPFETLIIDHIDRIPTAN